MGARLQSHERVGSPSLSTCVSEGEDLGMRQTGAGVESFADDAAVTHDDAADEGVRPCCTASTLGERGCMREMRVVDPRCDV
jgi:hypothetical protein